MLKALRWVLMGAALSAATGAHFWTVKRTVIAGTRQYGGPSRPVETHRFELLEYRYRPILVWRSAVQGGRTAHVEHTYGAFTIQEMRGTEWCGGGRGVLVESTVQYDYGPLHRISIFYDFQTDLLLTTLDYRTTDAELISAFSRCRGD